MSEQSDLNRYEVQLRLIGRHLDVHDYHGMVIFETEGGYIVRAVRPGSRHADALEFPYDSIASLEQQGSRSRGEGEREPPSTLIPTGYEDFLRALGYELDQRNSTAVVVAELVRGVVARGAEYRSVGDQMALSPFEMILDPTDIQQLLDAAFRRRG